MVFMPYSYDHGQPLPSEYCKTAGGDVSVGQCMALSEGRLTLSATPDYIALRDEEGAAEDTLIPVMHITRDMVFEAPLQAAADGLEPGSLTDVSADGLFITGTAAVNNLQIISMDGTAAGDLCRCRFVEV